MDTHLETLTTEAYEILESLDMLQQRVIPVAWHVIPRLQSEFRLPARRVAPEDEEKYLSDFLEDYKSGTFDLYLSKREQRWGFYRSPAWAEMKAKAYSVFGSRCMCCGETGVMLSVDHIIPRKVAPEREMDLRNLQILCQRCNLEKSGNTMDYRSREDLLNLIAYLNK